VSSFRSIRGPLAALFLVVFAVCALWHSHQHDAAGNDAGIACAFCDSAVSADTAPAPEPVRLIEVAVVRVSVAARPTFSSVDSHYFARGPPSPIA